MSDYMTVAEFARREGVSVQAVYKRLKGRLKMFATSVNGVTMLNIAAYDALYKKSADQPEQPEVNQTEPQINTDTQPQLISLLETQISEKDRQIARLQDQLDQLMTASADKDRHIQEQSIRLSELLAQSQELMRNNQVLMGMLQAAQPQEDEQQDEQPAPQQEDTQTDEQREKKSLWQRLFRH